MFFYHIIWTRHSTPYIKLNVFAKCKGKLVQQLLIMCPFERFTVPPKLMYCLSYLLKPYRKASNIQLDLKRLQEMHIDQSIAFMLRIVLYYFNMIDTSCFYHMCLPYGTKHCSAVVSKVSASLYPLYYRVEILQYFNEWSINNTVCNVIRS